MKKGLLFLVVCLYCAISFGQQELLLNGSFSLPNNQWVVTPSSQSLNNFTGGSYCSQSAGNYYSFFGDSFEQTGADNMVEGFYQNISIPSNASSVTLTFKMSISTFESFGAGAYDYFYVGILSSTGAPLQTLLNIDNTYGTTGIPGCAPWNVYTVNIPSSYFGQSLRLAFETVTDDTFPTIFRIDDASLLAFIPSPCTYSLSTSSFTCPTANGGTYPNVATVNTQAGCSWNASVLTGASWLSTTSQSNGSGSLNITVTQNTSSSSRTGTISVGGQILTVTQPGGGCAFALSSNNYVCPNSLAGTFNSIALVNTAAGCGWSATVSSGNSWLVCSSSGIGSGDVNIVVVQNTTGISRTGTLDIQGEVITITQPAAGVSVEEWNVNGDFAFFPNPTQGILTVENPAVEKQGLSISNEIGQVVRYEVLDSGKNTIDLTELSNGVYFMQLGDSKVEKLIVN